MPVSCLCIPKEIATKNNFSIWIYIHFSILSPCRMLIYIYKLRIFNPFFFFNTTNIVIRIPAATSNDICKKKQTLSYCLAGSQFWTWLSTPFYTYFKRFSSLNHIYFTLSKKFMSIIYTYKKIFFKKVSLSPIYSIANCKISIYINHN